MNLIQSTQLEANALALLNMILKACVTVPGGVVPISLLQVFGGITAGPTDCSKLQLVIDCEASQPATRVTISFPGSPFQASGYIDPLALAALMNPSPNYAVGNNGSQLGPAANVAEDAPSVHKQGSGAMAVSACISGTLSAQADVHVELRRDGTVLAEGDTSPGGLTPCNFALALSALDQLTDSSAHTYEIRASCLAQTLTIPVGGASVQVHEL